MSEKFVLGFIAGEGSFQLRVFKRDTGEQVRARFTPAFSLGVYEEEIVQMIRDEIGVGKISTVDERTTIRVQSFDDCLVVKEYVENNAGNWFKSTHKWEQFKLWRDGIELLSDWERDNPISKEAQKKVVDLSYEIPRSDTKNLDKQDWYDIIDEYERFVCGAEKSRGSEPCQTPVKGEDELCVWHRE